MKTNISLHQFVKDGLVGVVVALTVFVIIAVLVFMAGGYFDVVSMFSFTEPFPNEGGFFLGPMLFVILTAFIGIGVGGRYLETTTSRKEWEVAILKISGVSWLAGVGLSVIQAILFIVTTTGLADPISFMVSIVGICIVGCGFGALFGLIGGTAGKFFKPQKRLYKIVIGAISSALVGYGGGFVLALLFSGAFGS